MGVAEEGGIPWLGTPRRGATAGDAWGSEGVPPCSVPEPPRSLSRPGGSQVPPQPGSSGTARARAGAAAVTGARCEGNTSVPDPGNAEVRQVNLVGL